MDGIIFNTIPGISITTFYESFKKNKLNPPRIFSCDRGIIP